MKNKRIYSVIFHSIQKNLFLTVITLLSVAGSVILSLIPPLLLERLINTLTQSQSPAISIMIGYYVLLLISTLFDSLQQITLVTFGQRISHSLRSVMSQKLKKLPADTFVTIPQGIFVSYFVNDIDTIEDLFTDGIISMMADLFRIISIFIILFMKNKGLALLMLVVIPLVALYTKHVQKKTLQAQKENRRAVSQENKMIPEVLRNFRTIKTLQKESFFLQKYDEALQNGYVAMEKTNFYDAVYSPVIIICNTIVVAIVYLLSSTNNPILLSFFGMSVGTAVAVINYISQIFSPIESIGMEIQTVQSAIAGLSRIEEFLSLPEREIPEHLLDLDEKKAAILFKNVTFGYDVNLPVLNDVSFQIETNEHVTIIGRTGAGKSTIFKLLLGLYEANQGMITVYGQDVSKLSDNEKRKLFGYVEQTFHPVPGTILDQITLGDSSISMQDVLSAVQLTGLSNTIENLPQGYKTPMNTSLFSQGELQLLSIARSVVSHPKILLLDEITANLDVETEAHILDILQKASLDRTVVSISHRIHEKNGGRTIEISSTKKS